MALARKGNGNDVQPSSIPINRERISRRRSLETPTIRPKLPSNLRPQVMDLSGPEVCFCLLTGAIKVAESKKLLSYMFNYTQAYSDTASSRRHSLDLHELMQSSSPSWRRQTLNVKDEDAEFKSGEWIDKHEESINPQLRSLYVTHVPLH